MKYPISILNQKKYTLLRKIYILACLGFLYVDFVIPISRLLPEKIKSIVSSAIAFFGFLVVIISFLSKQIFFYRKRDYLLLSFLFITVISCLINIKYGFADNIKALIWTINLFFLVYMINPNLDKEYIKKEISLFSNVLISLWLVASIASLVMFVLNIGYSVSNLKDGFTRQGFIENRLFGVFDDPNHAAVTSVIVIALSLMQFISTHKMISKSVYIVSIAIQFSYVVLSGSRTAEFSLLAVTLIGSFILLKRYFNNQSKALKNILIFTIPIINCILIYFLIDVCKAVFAYIPMFFSSFSTSPDGQSTVSKVIMEREDISNNGDISNLRFKIWQSALEIFKTAPILGTSPRNIIPYAKSVLPDGYVAIRSYSLHNGYLNILVSTGIAGALCFLSFLFMRAYSYLKCIFTHNKNIDLRNAFCMLPPLAVIVSALFLTELCFYNLILILLFWLFLGYNCSHEKQKKEQLDE